MKRSKELVLAGPTLSLSYILHYAPQPSIMRSIGGFERAMKGGLIRQGDVVSLPVHFKDQAEEHQITIGPESFDICHYPFSRIDRFGPTATSLAGQFVKNAPSLMPLDLELRSELHIPVPDATRALGGYAVASFAWPRKLELRPEALGKDHFLPTESGMVRLRLSVHQNQEGHELLLMLSNKHDRVNADLPVLEQAYALCLTGIQNVVSNIASQAYQRALTPLLGSATQ